LKEALRGLEKIDRRLGGDVAILIGTVGSFTFAGALRGINYFMLDLIKKPDLAEGLLKKCRDFLLTYVDELKSRGALIILISDPMASLISPKMYERFVLPYQKDVFDRIRSNKTYSILHICGETTAILGKMEESRTDCLWLDQKIDLGYARKTLGSLCIMGNVDPVTTLLRGSKKEVEIEAKRCTNVTAKGGGFILSAGCEIPITAPPENIEALVNVARSYAP